MTDTHDVLNIFTIQTASNVLLLLTDDDLEMAHRALDERAQQERVAGEGFKIVAGLDIPTNEAVKLLQGERQRRWESKTVVCPHCDRGTTVNHRRCYWCQGFGRIPKESS